MAKRSIIDLPTRKKNRLLSKAPRPGHQIWCHNCDRDVAKDGQKCPTCGSVWGDKKFKPRDLP